MMDTAEAALHREVEWQSELIDVMFPIVTSAYVLVEERAQDHTPTGAICPRCLGHLEEALSRWNAWLNAVNVADGGHKGEEAHDGR
jgi:hypothetical protein